MAKTCPLLFLAFHMSENPPEANGRFIVPAVTRVNAGGMRCEDGRIP